MSQPKYAWYGEIRRRLSEGSWRHPKSFQDFILKKAVYEAEIDTERLPNSNERKMAIELVLYQRKSYTETSMKMYVSAPTIQRWVTSFVNLVGKKAGY